MSYSSALFDETRPLAGQDLAEAQLRKVNAILDLAHVREGSRVLEIGTGWGTLAIEAARRGARVTTLTLSSEQAELAHERVVAAGLGDLVEIRQQDYRDVAGTYDAVVSVEMIEAVGEEYWPLYFAALDRLLAPGRCGRDPGHPDGPRPLSRDATLLRMDPEAHLPGWPDPLDAGDQHDRAAAHPAEGRPGSHAFGPHYAETLRRWRHTFEAASPRLPALGFDETFRRKWEFYLAYSEAGFDSGYLDVGQIRLTRPTGGGGA